MGAARTNYDPGMEFAESSDPDPGSPLGSAPIPTNEHGRPLFHRDGLPFGESDPELEPYVNPARLVVDGSRGYDPIMARKLLTTRLCDVVVKQPEYFGINGVFFFVKGPDRRQAMQVVQLPEAIASYLDNKYACQQSAEDEWSDRTDKSLGGILTTRIYVP